MQSCLGGKAEPLGSALTNSSAIIFEQEDMDLLGEADVNTATSTSEELTDHSAIIFEQEDMDLLGEADVNTATSTSEEL